MNLDEEFDPEEGCPLCGRVLGTSDRYEYVCDNCGWHYGVKIQTSRTSALLTPAGAPHNSGPDPLDFPPEIVEEAKDLGFWPDAMDLFLDMLVGMETTDVERAWVKQQLGK